MMSEDGPRSGAAQKTGRRRRPSGEPPPLVRGAGWQRWAWGLLGVVLLGVLLAIGEATGALTGLDRAVGDAAVDLRTPALVDVAKAVDLLTAVPLIMVLRSGTVLALAVLGRFRHLVVFLATFVVTDWVVARALHVALEPPDVTGARRGGNLRIPVPVDRGARDHADRYLARARPTRSRPTDRRRGSCTGRSSPSFSPS